jgi:protein TonB
MPRLVLLLLFTASAFAGPTPYSVAALVNAKDEAAVIEQATAALQSPVPLVRATAARVVAVRGLTALLPLLRERVAAETDATAAREQIRALALAGTAEDVALAVKASARWPASMDNALAIAVARRGGNAAVDGYLSAIRKTRMTNHAEFFRVALWGHADLIASTGSRLLAAQEERGWKGILSALEESKAAMDRGVAAASLTTKSEEIRTASLWFLVRGYAVDPTRIPDVVKEKIVAERSELSSNREDFGLELLRRMLGAERKDSPRWLAFLDTDEADQLIGRSEEPMFQYLTDEEYRVRYNRCELQVQACLLPSKRSSRTIPSQAVAPPAFNLPELLPAGLAEAVMAGTKCRDEWLGVATASIDPSGRVKTLALDAVDTGGSCKQAIDTLLRLSFATNTSLRSDFTGPVLLVHPARGPLCLDEDVPRDDSPATLLRVGGDITAPVVKKRVEPHFPESARAAMRGGSNVIVILECVISSDGCVRSVRLLTQSPYPELNGAAVMAISQWTFVPGRLNGRPVDVIFNLTVNFRIP